MSQSKDSSEEDGRSDDAGDDDVDDVGDHPGHQQDPVAGLGSDGQSHVCGEQDEQPEVETVGVEHGRDHELREGDCHQVEEEAQDGQDEDSCI